MVEDALVKAKAEADKCTPSAPLVAKAAVPAAPSTPVAVANAPVISKESYVLLTDTLFKFDKSNSEDMIPGGLQRLADVAQRLKAYKSIQTLTVVGYTDRLGSDDYNDKLSEARAKTVQAYLESLGVKSASSVAQGKGKREPVSKDCSATAGREQQIICLQPDRRVTIEVTGVAK
jgi:OmpA-OmpF porin, OOP family